MKTYLLYALAAAACGIVGGLVVNPPEWIRRRFTWLTWQAGIGLGVSLFLTFTAHQHAGLLWKVKWFVLKPFLDPEFDPPDPRTFFFGMPGRDSELRALTTMLNGPFRTVGFANSSLPVNARVLVFRQADFAFYGNHRVVSSFDPIMCDIYRSRDTNETHERLRAIGIDHLFVPDYGEPTIYRTPLHSLLADSKRVELLEDLGGYRLFRLREPGERERELSSREIYNSNFDAASPSGMSVPGWTISGSPTTHWTLWSNEFRESVKYLRAHNPGGGSFRIYSGHGLFADPPRRLGVAGPIRTLNDIDTPIVSESMNAIDEFDHRHNALLTALRDEGSLDPQAYERLVAGGISAQTRVEPDEEYVLSATIRGDGIAALVVYEFPYTPVGKPVILRRHVVYEGPIRDALEFHTVKGMFRTGSIGTIRLALEHRNVGYIDIAGVALEAIRPNDASESPTRRVDLLAGEIPPATPR